MSVQIKGLCGWWMLALLSVSSLVAQDRDLRLVDAVKAGEQETLRALLNEGIDVNIAQVDGATALHWAALGDHAAMADLLIRTGALVNAADHYDVTPLSLACTNASPVMVEMLLEAEANPNATQETGETVLMTCARGGVVAAVAAVVVAVVAGAGGRGGGVGVGGVGGVGGRGGGGRRGARGRGRWWGPHGIRGRGGGVGDENYGEGSSREHAAMEPRHLGAAAVIVRSFARIHQANLKKQGVLPLTFVNPADYDLILETDRISILGLATLAPDQNLEMVVHHADGQVDRFEVAQTLNDEQIGWFRAGSALNLLRDDSAS